MSRRAHWNILRRVGTTIKVYSSIFVCFENFYFYCSRRMLDADDDDDGNDGAQRNTAMKTFVHLIATQSSRMSTASFRP